MTFSQVVLVSLTVLSLSFGQVLFKLAANTMNLRPFSASTILNPSLILALFVYFIATIMWLLVLRQIPLRIAYPYAALAFLFVPLLAYFLLGEKLYWNTFLGAALIFTGVWVSSFK